MHRLFTIAISAFAVDLVVAEGYYGGSNPALQQVVSTQPAYYPYFSLPPKLEDRNVCDLDASILLVTGRKYKAIRVRCSEIANYDEDSCNVCCQNAARRDRTLMNEAMFGFLALTEGNRGSKKTHWRKDSPEDLEEYDDNDLEQIRLPRTAVNESSSVAVATNATTTSPGPRTNSTTEEPTDDTPTTTNTTTTTSAPPNETTTDEPTDTSTTTTFAPTTTRTPGKKRSKEHRSRPKGRTHYNWKPLLQSKNVKCVCCGPKRSLPIYPLPIYNTSPQQSATGIYGPSSSRGY